MGASKSDAVRTFILARWTLFQHKTFHQPITSRRALFTAHRLLAAWNMFAIAALPFHFSFDECGKSKYVHLVTFSNGKLESVENLNVPVTCANPWRC